MPPSLLAAALVSIFAYFVLGLAAAKAQVPCADTEPFLDHFARKHNEQPRVEGATSSGKLLRILTSPDGKWSLLLTHPNGKSCLITAGEGFTLIERKPDGPGA